MKTLKDVLEKLKVDDIVFDKNLEDIIKKYLEDIYGKPFKVANVMIDKTPIVTAMYEMTKKKKPIMTHLEKIEKLQSAM